MASCRICGDAVLFSVAEVRSGICAVCETAPDDRGELPPRCRDLRPCECGGREFIRTVAHERQRAAAVAFLIKACASLKAIGIASGLSVPAPGGAFERPCFMEYFICRACGLTRCYALNAADLPLGPGHPSEIVRLPDRDPYR